MSGPNRWTDRIETKAEESTQDHRTSRGGILFSNPSDSYHHGQRQVCKDESGHRESMVSERLSESDRIEPKSSIRTQQRGIKRHANEGKRRLNLRTNCAKGKVGYGRNQVLAAAPAICAQS